MTEVSFHDTAWIVDAVQNRCKAQRRVKLLEHRRRGILNDLELRRSDAEAQQRELGLGRGSECLERWQGFARAQHALTHSRFELQQLEQEIEDAKSTLTEARRKE